jgi:hypothetical protein
MRGQCFGQADLLALPFSLQTPLFDSQMHLYSTPHNLLPLLRLSLLPEMNRNFHL